MYRGTLIPTLDPDPGDSRSLFGSSKMWNRKTYCTHLNSILFLRESQPKNGAA